jgi:hypothetical protein
VDKSDKSDKKNTKIDWNGYLINSIWGRYLDLSIVIILCRKNHNNTAKGRLNSSNKVARRRNIT